MNYLKAAGLLLACAIAAAPAVASPVDHGACAAIAAQLGQKTAEFVKVNANGRVAVGQGHAAPSDFYRSLGKRDAALQTISGDVWTLRADMANRNCSQAAAFTY